MFVRWSYRDQTLKSQGERKTVFFSKLVRTLSGAEGAIKKTF